jgi:uncharacterized membrane protein YfcA
VNYVRGCRVQEMVLGWQIVLGTLIGFFGAAFGSVGGVGGGGIFVPMLTLIIGFDPKSSTAISKCENLTPSSCMHAMKATVRVLHIIYFVSSFCVLCFCDSFTCAMYIHLRYLSCPILVIVYCNSKVRFLLIRALRYS